MTTIAHCLTLDQALFLRSLLDGCGIEAFIPDELAAQADPVIFLGSMNSVRVQVADELADAALEVLAANDVRPAV